MYEPCQGDFTCTTIWIENRFLNEALEYTEYVQKIGTHSEVNYKFYFK